MGTPIDTAALSSDRLDSALLAADRSVPLVDFTVGGLLAARASEHRDRVALVGVRHGAESTVRLTYGQLFDEATQVAAAFAAVTEFGDLVAVWAPNLVEWTVIQYGAALAGVVLVALNPVLRSDDLAYALTHSKARVLLHADVSRGYAMAEVAEGVCDATPGVRRISLSQ